VLSFEFDCDSEDEELGGLAAVVIVAAAVADGSYGLLGVYRTPRTPQSTVIDLIPQIIYNF
jgi:hypothetical protein